MYGDPLLVVADMGKGIEGAVREVFGEEMRLLICHFHFLRDIGKDFLSKEYDKIRSLLRKYGVGEKLRYRLRMLIKGIEQDPLLTKRHEPDIDFESYLTQVDKEQIPELAIYFLLQWALAGKKTGDAYGFPFDRPHLVFALRHKEVSRQLDILRNMFCDNQTKYNRLFTKVSKDIKSLIEDKVLWQTVKKLNDKIEIFDDLRDALRIAPVGAQKGLNDEGSTESIKKIEDRVQKFMDREGTYRKLQKQWSRVESKRAANKSRHP